MFKYNTKKLRVYRQTTDCDQVVLKRTSNGMALIKTNAKNKRSKPIQLDVVVNLMQFSVNQSSIKFDRFQPRRQRAGT